MMLSTRAYWIGLAVLMVAQTLVLGSIVWGRQTLLATGREIVLPVVPVDPRDIFRGDYVVLGYDLSTVNIPAASDGTAPSGLRDGDVVYVVATRTPAAPAAAGTAATPPPVPEAQPPAAGTPPPAETQTQTQTQTPAPAQTPSASVPQANAWRVARASSDKPADVAPEDIVLKGRVVNVWRDAASQRSIMRVRYGIETYFVPEGTGKILEEQVRDKKIEAIVRVDDGGTAALKGLVIDGERHEAPPLL
ncbi:MAG: GDYXXLXY domain-containing protein [Hyphomicrobium sp.]